MTDNVSSENECTHDDREHTRHRILLAFQPKRNAAERRFVGALSDAMRTSVTRFKIAKIYKNCCKRFREGRVQKRRTFRSTEKIRERKNRWH